MPPGPAKTTRDFPPAYWSLLPHARLYLGDVRKCLTQLPPRSVHCVVTSPPYWGLRDYGVCPCSVGGSPQPECKMCGGSGRTIDKSAQIGNEPSPDCGTQGRDQCGECFVCNMVYIFRELRRVLRDDGVLWLNIGDTYSSSTWRELPAGNIIGVPWRVALALQNDGWVLRQDVIWSKTTHMTESVDDRCTKSHEYIFHFTKSNRYFFDQIAIARTGINPSVTKTTVNSSTCRQVFSLSGKVPTGGNGVPGRVWKTGDTGNQYSVWVLPPGRHKDHPATFSTDLAERCVLSSTSEWGACMRCESPYERVVSKTEDNSKRTTGWRKTCGCRTDDVVPCTVLDPFVGSGTTVVAAVSHSRYAVGIDVSRAYLDEHAIPRIQACIVGGSGVKRDRSRVVSPSRYDPPPTPPVRGI